jgi:putative PIN family toxin of toxin-antitoxin system
VEETHAAAVEEAAVLAEVLPYDSPSDLLLVTSGPILTEVQQVLMKRYNHTAAESAAKRFFVASIAVKVVPDFEPDSVARFITRDPSDDKVVHTALAGGAEFIVTSDDDFLEDGEGTRYGGDDGGGFTMAYSLNHFAEELETSKFSLMDVPEVLSLRPGDRPPSPIDIS